MLIMKMYYAACIKDYALCIKNYRFCSGNLSMSVSGVTLYKLWECLPFVIIFKAAGNSDYQESHSIVPV